MSEALCIFSFCNMDIIMLSPFELLRKLSQKGSQHVNNSAGIWFQIYLSVKPGGPGSEKVSPLQQFHLQQPIVVPVERKLWICLFSLVHCTVQTQVFQSRSNPLVSKLCENPSICFLATVTPINTPEHTILLFSNSISSVGGIRLVLAP